MEPNNRQSIRIRAAVPGRFLVYAAQPATEQLYEAFGLSASFARGQAIADLDTALSAALARVPDAVTREALQLLQRRMDVLLAPPAMEHLPPPLNITLSAQGIGIESPDPIAVGDWIALYLVLDGVHPLLACAEVMWCERAASEQFRCGARFSEMPPDQARRLSKFVLQRSRTIRAA